MNELISVAVESILVGTVKRIGEPPFTSAISKHPVNTPIRVTFNGLEGDEQADRKHHGGPEKALHLYPREHYTHWQQLSAALKFNVPGAFGENLSTRGLTERDVCIGDVFALGTALIQVSQVRQPCWKLNRRFAIKHMARLVQESGYTGWYFRVLREGCVQAGDLLLPTQRLHPGWPLSRLNQALYFRTHVADHLAELAALASLSPGMRKLFFHRLARAETEVWTERLEGPQHTE